MRQLSSADAQMLFIEQRDAPNHVAALWVYGPRPDGGSLRYQDVVETVGTRLHLARAFREVLVRVPFDLDEPWWVRIGSPDLELHVREIALPRNASWREFFDLVARIHAQPLDLTRPPWELYVIGGLDELEGAPVGAAALLLKVHHAAVDGISGLEMATALNDHEPGADPVPAEGTGDSWVGDHWPSAWTLLPRALINDVMKPLHGLRAIGRALPALGRVPVAARHRQLGPPSLRVPVTRFNARVTPHRSIDCRAMPFAEIRRLRGLVPGATVNDVALAIVAGGLRSYLSEKGELPEGSLVALVPISTRQPDEKGGGGNMFAMLPAPLHTDVADPVERLQAIHAGMASAKALAEAVGARTLREMSTLLPGRLFGLATRAQMAVEAALGTRLLHNTVVTNVPGSRLPLYFCDAPLLHAFGAGPIPNRMGLIHLVGTHCGELTMNVTADRAMLPDPACYGDCLMASLSELSAASRKSEGGGRRRQHAVGRLAGTG